VSGANKAASQALEAQVQQAVLQLFAGTGEVQDAVAGDLVSAAAAAAAAAVKGGSVWSTSLPFSAAVRQRRFLFIMALVLAVLIIRTVLSIMVLVDQRRVEVCLFPYLHALIVLLC
jgi:hypothetical protein